jgi:hypothetical protein
MATTSEHQTATAFLGAVDTEEFRHEPLNQDDPEIRLIRFVPSSEQLESVNEPTINLRIEHVKLEDINQGRCGSYKALSYTWGSHTASHRIHINGLPFKVRTNLYAFLREFKDREEGYFWIDQLCIDQSHVIERNHQVALMSSIYSKAEVVYVWLGQPSDSSALALAILQEYENLVWPRGSTYGLWKAEDDERVRNFWNSKSKPERQAVAELLSNKYWTRVWIVQELFLAVNLVIFVGAYSLVIDKDNNSSRYGRDKDAMVLANIRHGSLADTVGDTLYLFRMIMSRSWNIREQGFTSSFWGFFLMITLFQECADARDHVFGIQACLKSTERVQVDYSLSRQQVYDLCAEVLPPDELVFNQRAYILSKLHEVMVLTPARADGPSITIRQGLRERSKAKIRNIKYEIQNLFS